MTTTITPDLCVIGAGESGLGVAFGAAALGVPVAVVERGPVGGARRSVRLSAFIAAARRAQQARDAASMGIGADPIIDFAALKAHMERAASALAADSAAPRLTAMGITLVKGEGVFTDRRTLRAGGTLIRARRFVIATGSRPVIPAIAGLETVPFLTPDGIPGLTELPQRLLVLGGGREALELGQACRRLGSQVEILASGDFLETMDPELAAPALAGLHREGVALRAHARVTRAEATADGVQLTLEGEDEPLSGSHLLVADGRMGVTESLGLDRVGVRCDGGGIRVNAGLRTSRRRIYAVGEAASTGADHHSAAEQAGVVLRATLFRLPVRSRPEQVAWAMRTGPEVAHVGLTEAEARTTVRTIRIARWPFHLVDGAQAEAAPGGHVKVITDRRGRILGASILGEGAGEGIMLWAGLVRRRARLDEALLLVAAYPAKAEAARLTALIARAPYLTNPRLQRIIGALRKLG